MRVTSFSVKRRIATSVIITALVVLGLYGLLKLPVNFLPDMTYPLIKVHIWWPGATPEDIDTEIADPIERQMATVDGLDYLESSSIEGMYTLQANFRYGVDIDVAYQDTLAAMGRVARQLPKEIDPPIIIKADPSQLPVAQLTISSEEIDLVKLRTWTENWLQDQLLSVSGVAGTEVVGGMKREIRVHIDPMALEKYSLPLTTVIKRLGQENIQQFGGRITEGKREFIARTTGEYQNINEISSIVIANNDTAGKVYLRDIATVEDSNAEVRVITRLNGKPCIKLSVLKQADANTVEVAGAVKDQIERLKDSFPSDVRISMVENQADYVQAALNGVRNTALEAAVLVIITVYLFLGSIRQVLVMALALPITLLINFALMKLAGFSLNIFSLSGLVVAIGVALDNSIVVIENITRLIHGMPDETPELVAVKGTSEVGQALVAATASFLALFLPFLLVPGLTSLLFKELILVTAGVILISLLMAVTITPMLSVTLMSGQVSHKKSRFEELFERFVHRYSELLYLGIKHKWFIVAASLVLLILAGVLATRLGSEFLPRMDDGRVMVKVRLPTGASISETDRVLRQVEEKLKGDPLIDSMFTLAGGKVWGLYTYEIANEGEVNIQLVPKNNRKVSTEDYLKKIRPIISQIQVAGGKLIVAPMKVKGLRSLGEAEIEVRVTGQDIRQLFSLARNISGAMTDLKSFTNVYVSMDLNKPEYKVQIDRAKAAELGVSVSDISSSLKSLISGAVATKYREGSEQYNIRAIVPEKMMTSRQAIEMLPLLPVKNGYLRISDVAKVMPATGPVEIIRYNQVKQVVVRGDTSGTSIGEALKSLQRSLEKIDMPAGYSISIGGQAQMMKEMLINVLAILAFAVFFSFVALAVQFNSLKLPALILGTLPFCIAGLIIALVVTNLPLGATVLIGALIMFAAHINGGVLILSLAEELRAKGESSPIRAIVNAASIRLRPRLMISFMIITGLIPLALNLQSGGEMLQPMAVAAIGGIIAVIFVSLFLLPCLYVMVTKDRQQG